MNKGIFVYVSQSYTGNYRRLISSRFKKNIQVNNRNKNILLYVLWSYTVISKHIQTNVCHNINAIYDQCYAHGYTSDLPNKIYTLLAISFKHNK